MPLRSRSLTRMASVGALFGLALAGCSSPIAAPADQQLSTSAANDERSTASSAVWDFPAATVDGRAFETATVQGRPVVAWFWTPWCTVCRAEAGDVAEIAKEFDGDVTFIGVAGLGDVADMREFVATTETDGFTHLEDDDGSIWGRFGVISQPSFAFVGADGQVEVFGGALGPNELRLRTERLLG